MRLQTESRDVGVIKNSLTRAKTWNERVAPDAGDFLSFVMTVEVVLVDIIERRIQERMAGEFYPRFLIQLPSSPSLAYTSVSQPTMRLTIIAPDSVHEHEVSPSLLIQDIINIVEATVSQL